MTAVTEENLRQSLAERARYDQDGFLIRERVFDAAELAELQRAVERAAAEAARRALRGRTYHLDGKRFVDVGHVTVQFEHSPGSDTLRVIEPVHELDATLDALVDDQRLVAPMTDLVGSRAVALWTDKLNLKSPRDGSGFGRHQDSPYWVHACDHVDQLPNVFIALDDATEANGCFRVIRGSHTRGCLPGTDDGTQLGGFFADPASFDAADQVAMVVPAGSLVFFNPHAVHGSLPNVSPTPGRALVFTYQPTGQPMLKSGRVRNAGVYD